MSQAAVAAAPAGGNKKLIIIAATVVLLAAIGGGVAVMLKGGGGKEAEKEHAEEVVHEPVYINITPEFVINFSDKAGHSKYLKAELSVVTKEPDVEKAIEKHMPAIRNALVLLLSLLLARAHAARSGQPDALRSVSRTAGLARP